MKVLLLLATFIVSVISEESLTDPGESCVYLPEDVKYVFYNIENPVTPIIVPSDNLGAIKDTHFNKLKPTLILVHGGGDNTSGPFAEQVRTYTVANKIDINLIVVDWLGFQERWGRMNISDFYSCAPLFGTVVSGFIKELVSNHGLNYDDLAMAGHSIASRFCRVILGDLPNKIKHFMGLESCVVYAMNAKFIECIITDRGEGDFNGMANYFPNGGSNQPGCPPLPDWSCSHWRSVYYYAESLATNKFVAKKCDSYANYKAGKCANNETGIMGGLNPDVNARGHYFLETNANTPFAKG